MKRLNGSGRKGAKAEHRESKCTVSAICSVQRKVKQMATDLNGSGRKGAKAEHRECGKQAD